jgi:hypothetical protein
MATSTLEMCNGRRAVFSTLGLAFILIYFRPIVVKYNKNIIFLAFRKVAYSPNWKNVLNKGCRT